MENKNLKFEIKNRIAYLKLSSPPKNEMSNLFFSELSDIVENKLKDNKEISALIILSEGRHFSSGANIDELLSYFHGLKGEIPPSVLQNCRSFYEISQMPYPVVACIRGVCFGAAFELALFAHYRISTQGALFALPESSFDLLPGLGGIQNMYICSGKAKTIEYCLTGKNISANEAKEVGLIDMIVPKNEIVSTAVELIESLPVKHFKELKKVYLKEFLN